MKTSLSRWGSTLAIRLPEAELAFFGLREGAALDVTFDQNLVVLTKTLETKAQFVADLWACKEAGLQQEPLWDDGARGSESL